jgi:site-specific DNA recombinase
MKSQDKRGIIYCRVSSLDQVEGTSLDSQERLCHEWAERQKIKIVKVYIERGESAKTANRTEFTKAINYCKENKVNSFIVYKLDRFARRVQDYSNIKDTLRQFGTELMSATEPFSNGPAGIALEQMLSVFAEFDNNVRRERTVQGMQERIKQGVWVWQCPVGYHRVKDGENISIDPAKSIYIKMIFEEYAKGVYTFKALSELVSNKGFRTHFGCKPTQQIIEKILKNPIYCGIIKAWGQEIDGSFEGIVSKELFAQCQPGYQTGTTPRSSNNPEFPLRKLVVCSECKQPITGSNSTGRRSKKYAYYHHHKQNCEKSLFLPKETFEQMFVEYLDSITPDEKYEKLFKAIVIDIWKNNYKVIDQANSQVRKEITILESERQEIFELHRKKIYNDQEFDEQRNKINERIKQKNLLLQDKVNESFDMEEVLDHCFKFVRYTSNTWLKLSNVFAERLQFQKRVFDGSIEFDGVKFSGTANLTPIYRINKEYSQNKKTSSERSSYLVTPPGIEPGLPG